MKIGYFADGLWAHKAIKKIIASSELNIVFIVPRYDMPDLGLKEIAERYGIPFIIHPNVNSQEFLEKVSKYQADIFVSMSFNQILKKPIIEYTSKGFINCHAGALPYYRGRNVLNWAIINDEKCFGVTVHYVDEGIDTGDIILQKFIEIDFYDNYNTVLQKAYHTCADILMEALFLIKNDRVEIVRQSSVHPVGFYCGRRIDGDEVLDWSWSSRRIYNFVRALSVPGPCARTYCHQKEIALLETELIENAPNYIGTPGEVVGRDSKGTVVKTGDNTIRVLSIADISQNNELINKRIPSHRIGTRFGINLFLKIRELEEKLQKLKE